MIKYVPFLLLITLFIPTVGAYNISISIGDSLKFSLEPTPMNASVTWYTEDGENFEGNVLVRDRGLIGLKRVTAVVNDGLGGINTSTFRYYTTKDTHKVYPIDEKSFGAWSVLNITSNVATLWQVDGRGFTSTKKVSLGGIEISIEAPSSMNVYLLFFQFTGDVNNLKISSGSLIVEWSGGKLPSSDVNSVLNNKIKSSGYVYRDEERFLIIKLNSTQRRNVLSIDWQGGDRENFIPNQNSPDKIGDNLGLIILIFLSAAGGIIIGWFIQRCAFSVNKEEEMGHTYKARKRGRRGNKNWQRKRRL